MKIAIKFLTYLKSASRISCAVFLFAAALLSTGCATRNSAEKPVHQRGWIGGEYKLARQPRWMGRWDTIDAFPGQLKDKQRTGILVAALSSNTPARLAGLQEGDLILEINHQPVKCLADFRRTIDRLEPGILLPVKVYRNGGTIESTVCVGRETFREQGNLMITLPPIFRELDLWPNPDFSLVVLGYRQDHARAELGSVEAAYRRNCDPKGYHPVDGDWKFWLVIMELSRSKIILSQENVPRGVVLAGQASQAWRRP